DEQGREQTAGGDRVHHDRQQWNADNGESATERSLHEADQEDAGKGDQDRGNRQVHGGHHHILPWSGRVMKPWTAASISERAMPMSRSARSSNPRRDAMAVRRTKWQAIPTNRARNTGPSVSAA